VARCEYIHSFACKCLCVCVCVCVCCDPARSNALRITARFDALRICVRVLLCVYMYVHACVCVSFFLGASRNVCV
jgi:hypothetical protein